MATKAVMRENVLQPAPGEQFAGIDVSAATLQVALRGLDGEVRDLEFTNDAVGHGKLVALLTKGKRTARVCLEATSLYGLDLAIALAAAKVAVMVVNPKAARRFAGAMMQRAKTDRVDARVLLEYVRRMDFVAWSPPSTARQTLRLYARRIHDIVCQATAEKNRLHALHSTTTTPEALLRDVREAITALEKRAEDLIEAAWELMASDTELAAARAALLTVPGIAKRSAIALLGELALLPADMTAREVVAHAGLDPRPRESGTSVKGRRSISKVGSAALRASLHMPALVAVRHDDVIRRHYDALVAAGKPKMVAIVAVSRKLLHAIWHLVCHGGTFDPAKFSPRFASGA
jgi:transposase